MTRQFLRTNLAGWENEPVIQDQVIAYMDGLGCAALLREIYRPLGLPRYTVNRVLGRLHAKGIVTRYKIPVQLHRPGRRSRPAPAGEATWQCFLYQLVDGPGQ